MFQPRHIQRFLSCRLRLSLTKAKDTSPQSFYFSDKLAIFNICPKDYSEQTGVITGYLILIDTANLHVEVTQWVNNVS